MCVDLADWTATRQAVEALPPIDLLVNNAGIFIRDAFLDAKPEDFDKCSVYIRVVSDIATLIHPRCDTKLENRICQKKMPR